MERSGVRVVPLDGDARPMSKEQQLARKERRYKRRVASPKQWQMIAAERQGPCLTCGSPAPNELHHILPRVRGGEDKARNIAPLCSECHGILTRRASAALARMFVAALDDEQYAYAVTNGGETIWESVYGLKYVAGVGRPLPDPAPKNGSGPEAVAA